MLGLMGQLSQPRANLIRLISLKRAGVSLPSTNAELGKNIENRARLDFKLFREIVNSNLTHPPLFTSVLPIRP
jgi:hypothetical protein